MSTEQHEAPNQPDPWKSFRGVMAGTLILEAIVGFVPLYMSLSTSFGKASVPSLRP